MAKMNAAFLDLKKSYLFIETGRRIREFIAANPEKNIIKMGIGDVTLPLAPVCVSAMEKAAAEMGVRETFRGYEDSGRGYDFLREAVAGYYAHIGVTVEPDEVFISDGAKSDTGNIGDIVAADRGVIVTDPAYPVYVDSSIMGGKKVFYADSTEENGFCAMPDEALCADMIYLCSPNNPTGSVFTKKQLKAWVDYAIKTKAVIIFDAAYEAFVSQPELPRSIFEIEGARKCAVEICSLSKTAGFTGTRCGYTVIPKELMLETPDGGETSFLQLWARRQGSKFNGVSYPVQRAAEAVFSEEGLKQTRQLIDYYMENAKLMAKTFDELGIKYTGGINSPYLWFKCPDNADSWTFFDRLLSEAGVAGTPGEGFGKNGAGWFRLTAFNTHENTAEAMRRIKAMLAK